MRDWAKYLQRYMPLTDFVLTFFAFRLGYALRYEIQLIRPVDEFYYAPFSSYFGLAVAYGLWLIATPPMMGLYRPVRGRSWLEESYTVAQAATTATVIIMAINFLIQPLVFSRLMILEVTVLVVVCLSLNRIFFRSVRAFMHRRGVGTENVLIIGAGDIGRAVMGGLMARKDLGYRVLGYLDDNPERGEANMGRIKGYGPVDALPATLTEVGKVDLVIITLPWRANDKILEIVAICERHGIQARVVPDLFRLNLSRVRIEALAGIPLIGFNTEAGLSGTNRLIKRIVDVVLVLAVLPILLLPAIIIAILIKLDSPGPIFYRQRRVGENGNEFNMVKFRSMYRDADDRKDDLIRQTGIDGRHFKMKDDPRVTRVGRWLRRLSIDEWPNFWNILRGEMSLIGPRAPTPKEVEQYEPWQRQRLNTLPGLSGLWQVSGRSDVPFEEMCLLDIYYIENWSIRLDVEIILRTIPHVLFARGAY